MIQPSRRQMAVARRGFDMIFAALGLLLLAPGMLLIAIAVRIDTPGRVFFVQPRLGRDGRTFQLYKFRKFRHQPHEGGCPVTLKNDPRMTRLGRILERSKLDELPQLLNVLRGDMAMVGPRPETTDFADCFAGRYRQLLDYRPGLFGPNQAIFRNESDLYPHQGDPSDFYRTVLFPAKADIDLDYCTRRTMLADIGWILRGTAAALGRSPQSRRLGAAAISTDGGRECWPPSRTGLPAAPGTLDNPSGPTGCDIAVPRAGSPSGRRPVVCVQGLGFVGAAVCIAVASARDALGRPAYDVIGIDLPTSDGLARIAALNHGLFPFATSDATLSAKALEAHVTGNLSAGTSPGAFAGADIIMIDVPLSLFGTPGHETLGMEGFRQAVRVVGRDMAPGALVIVETTVPPGTTARVVAPILAEELKLRGERGDGFLLAHCYERVMPGATYLASIRNMPRVYAGIDEPSAAACDAFLRSLVDTATCPPTRVSSTTASELAKVLENSYRAVTIAMMDEFASFAEAVGVDLPEIVVPIRLRPTHSNMRMPGFGVGGYCLTKDPLLGRLAAGELFGLEQAFPFCTLAVAINRDMPLRALARLGALLGGTVQGRRILLLGVSYRQDVADTRYSASETFHEAATAAGARVIVHDPIVRFWLEQKLNIAPQVPSADGLDAVVLAVPHLDYRQFDYAAWLGDARPVLLDAFDVLSREQRAELRALGCTVESIGRGSGL